MSLDAADIERTLRQIRRFKELWDPFARDLTLFFRQVSGKFSNEEPIDDGLLARLRSARDRLKVQLGVLEHRDAKFLESHVIRGLRTQLLKLRFTDDAVDEIVAVSGRRADSFRDVDSIIADFSAMVDEVGPFLEARIQIFSDDLESSLHPRPKEQSTLVAADQVTGGSLSAQPDGAGSEPVDHRPQLQKSPSEMSLGELGKLLTVPQLWGLLAALFTLLGGAFLVGRWVERVDDASPVSSEALPAQLAFLPSDLNIDLTQYANWSKPRVVPIQVASRSGSVAFLRSGAIVEQVFDTLFFERLPQVELISVVPSKPTLGAQDSAVVALELLIRPLVPAVDVVLNYPPGSKVPLGSVTIRLVYREGIIDRTDDVTIPIFFLRPEASSALGAESG